jgi:hypothetical protein
VNEDKPTTRLVSIRVEEDMKSRLEEIALNSDRSITQLCRYAVSSYLLSSSPDLGESVGSDDPRLSEVIGIRLPVDVITELRTIGEDTSLSTLLRSILHRWLETAHFSQLPCSPAR